MEALKTCCRELEVPPEAPEELPETAPEADGFPLHAESTMQAARAKLTALANFLCFIITSTFLFPNWSMSEL